MVSLICLSTVCQRRIRPVLFCNTHLSRGLVAYQKNRDVPLPAGRIHATSHSTVLSSSAVSRHWTGERVLSISLLGMVPAAYLCPGPVVDHSHTARTLGDWSSSYRCPR